MENYLIKLLMIYYVTIDFRVDIIYLVMVLYGKLPFRILLVVARNFEKRIWNIGTEFEFLK